MSPKALLETIVILCGIGFFICLIWATVFSHRYMRNQRLKRFKGRSSLTSDEFYHQFYSGSRIPRTVVLDALKGVSEATEIAEGLIRPTDRFDTELAPAKGWEELDDASFELKTYAEKVGNRAVNLSNVQTVGDYIELVAECSQQRTS